MSHRNGDTINKQEISTDNMPPQSMIVSTISETESQAYWGNGSASMACSSHNSLTKTEPQAHCDNGKLRRYRQLKGLPSRGS
jgi:hypothetical protein